MFLTQNAVRHHVTCSGGQRSTVHLVVSSDLSVIHVQIKCSVVRNIMNRTRTSSCLSALWIFTDLWFLVTVGLQTTELQSESWTPRNQEGGST